MLFKAIRYSDDVARRTWGCLFRCQVNYYSYKGICVFVEVPIVVIIARIVVFQLGLFCFFIIFKGIDPALNGRGINRSLTWEEADALGVFLCC